MNVLLFALVGGVLLFSNGCVDSSFSQNQSNEETTVKNEVPKVNDNLSLVLWGAISYKDVVNNNQTTVRISPEQEMIEYNQNRGISIQLPAVGSTIEMDVMNCNQYLGTLKVTYTGEKYSTWKTESFPETWETGLEQKMLKCADNPNSEFTKKYLSNQIYLFSPSDKQRRSVKNIKKPIWKDVVSQIPYEWRKIGKLPMFPTDKQAEDCIADWLDSDGDGKIDILTMCAINDENTTENHKPWKYNRILQLVDGNWRQIWVGVDTKD